MSKRLEMLRGGASRPFLITHLVRWPRAKGKSLRTFDGNKTKVSDPSSEAKIRFAFQKIIATSADQYIQSKAQEGIDKLPPLANFSSFSLKKIKFSSHQTAFDLDSSFTLTANNQEFNFLTDAVILRVGPYVALLPSGSFVKQSADSFEFSGVVDGAPLDIEIKIDDVQNYRFKARGKAIDGLSHLDLTIPIIVSITVGRNFGSATGQADTD
jgi:hypothetical protein